MEFAHLEDVQLFFFYSTVNKLTDQMQNVFFLFAQKTYLKQTGLNCLNWWEKSFLIHAEENSMEELNIEEKIMQLIDKEIKVNS